MLASDRLQQSALDAQTRAEEAERTRAAQAALNDQLGSQVEEQRRLLEVIQELEAPAIPIQSGVLVLPLVGHLDARRLGEVERRLLDRVAGDRTEMVLIDITGVRLIDTVVADGLIRMAQAVRLLGARIVLTGLQPPTAQTLAQLELNMGFVKTYTTIAHALAHAELDR